MQAPWKGCDNAEIDSSMNYSFMFHLEEPSEIQVLGLLSVHDSLNFDDNVQSNSWSVVEAASHEEVSLPEIELGFLHWTWVL
jgi:hypothetical protein